MSLANAEILGLFACLLLVCVLNLFHSLMCISYEVLVRVPFVMCVWLCVCLCVVVCVHMRMCMCLHLWVCGRVHVCGRVCVPACMCVHHACVCSSVC